MVNIKFMKDVAIPMRDGLNLAGNVWLPDVPGKYPVILGFTGFGKDAPWSEHIGTDWGWNVAYEPWSPTLFNKVVFEANDPEFWCNYGYGIAVVDPRGLNRSPGTLARAEIDGPPGEYAMIAEGRWARDQYDTIEWMAQQDWCDGNIALSGVSVYGFSQWRVAGLNPPHLKCINPWEAMTNFYRDCMFPGGMPEIKFTQPSGEFCHPMGVPEEAWPAPGNENPPEKVEMEEDDFLQMITLPALICCNWTDHGCHARGILRAYQKISSEHKWMYTHGRLKWAEFYTSEARVIRKMFFDCFLKGTDNRILSTPSVRLGIMENEEKYTVRYEQGYPVPGTVNTKLFLDAGTGTMGKTPAIKKCSAGYKADRPGCVRFEYVFEEDTEIIGPSALHLSVSTDASDDMDLFVTMRKFDTEGKEVHLDTWIARHNTPVALGWLRLSHRELDPEKSTEIEPYLKHVIGEGDKVKQGEIVECDIPILCAGFLFRKGEKLTVEVGGLYRSGERLENQPFDYDNSVNKGNHTLYTGGEYGSYIIIPLCKFDPQRFVV